MSEASYQYLTASVEDGVLVLTIGAPELTGDELANALRREMLEAAASAESGRVVVSFRHVTYLASPGIRMLLSVRRQLTDAGGRLVLCSMARMIADVLSTARLITPNSPSLPALFETAPDEATAVDLLK